MLRLFGDEIGKIGKKMIGGGMKKAIPNQTYFVESLDKSTDIDRLEELAGKRLNQLEWLISLNWKAICELRSLCRELPVNYKKRYPIVDKFLNQVGDDVLVLYSQVEIMKKIFDALDSFCAGDFSAVEEINES